MYRLIVLPALAVLLSFAVPSVALAASNTELKVDVYPLDCVFEYVDDGSNRIIYVTPEECGQEIITEPTLPVPDFLQDPITVTGPVAFREIVDSPEPGSQSGDPARTPVSGAEQNGESESARATVALTVLIVGVVGTAVGVGIDFLAYEAYFSKAAVKWTGSRAADIGHLIIRRPKDPL